jgi:hypothetical protein
MDLQTRLLWTLSQACKVADVKPARCDRQDSGDGQILVLPPSIDESKVLPGLVLGLLTAVHRANESPGAGGRMRLRISLGQGAIQVGATGFASQAVITVARLLDSADLRAALAADQVADGAIVVTSDLYHDMFSQGYGGLPPNGFHEVQIHIPAKRFTATAWIQVPANPPLLLKVPVYPDMAALARRQQRMRDIGAAMAIAWASFAGAEMLLAGSAGASIGPYSAGDYHAHGPHDGGHHGTTGAAQHDASGHDHPVLDHLVHDGLGRHDLGHDWQAHPNWADGHGEASHGHGGHGHDGHGEASHGDGGHGDGMYGHADHGLGDSEDPDADSDDSVNRSSLRPHANDFGPGHDHDYHHDALGHDAAGHDALGHDAAGYDAFGNEVVSVDTAYGYDATGYFDAAAHDSHEHDAWDHHDGADHHDIGDHHTPGMDGHGGLHI